MSTTPSTSAQDASYTPPSRLFRLQTLFRHGRKIVMYQYPGYTLQDLAAVQDSIDGPSFQRAADRMLADPVGRQIMEDQPRINLRSVDWRALSMMPLDSLGYNFWHHLYSNGILQDVNFDDPVVRYDKHTEYAKTRYRETHDLRHVMLGVGISGPDEVILQSFQCAQLFQYLSLGIITIGAVKFAITEGETMRMFRCQPKAWQVGKNATFLSNVYFEKHWETPLEDFRRMHNITAVGDAYPVKERHPDAPWTRPAGDA